MSQPLYQRIKAHVRTRVRSGDWPVGFRIPSENRLVEEMGVSRMTVHRALRELTQEGVLARYQGVGTFVREPAHQTSLLELRNIAEEIRARGHEHRAQQVALDEVVAPPRIAARFQEEIGWRAFHAVLVHYENDLPVQLEDRYVHPQVAPDFLAQDFRRQPPTEYLLAIAPVAELEHVVRANLPGPEAQELLEVEPLEPCLELHRRSWTTERVASVVTLTYPASRYELRGRYRTTPAGTLGAPRPDPHQESRKP